MEPVLYKFIIIIIITSYQCKTILHVYTIRHISIRLYYMCTMTYQCKTILHVYTLHNISVRLYYMCTMTSYHYIQLVLYYKCTPSQWQDDVCTPAGKMGRYQDLKAIIYQTSTLSCLDMPTLDWLYPHNVHTVFEFCSKCRRHSGILATGTWQLRVIVAQ